MKLKWLVLAVGLAAVVLGMVVLWEPTGILLGHLRGESFFQGRPTNYWRQALQNSDPASRTAAVETLKQGGASAVAVLVELLKDDRSNDWSAAEVRWTAAEILGELGTDAAKATPDLLAALHDPDAHVRSVAALMLQKVGAPPEQAVPPLIGLLDGNDRLRAVEVLSQYRGDARAAVPRLKELLKDPQPDMRWSAAMTLGEIGPEAREAVPALVSALNDEHALVREHAAESLGLVGVADSAVLEGLIKALKDKEARVRRDAVRSLGQFGPAARSALPAIWPLRNDDSERVRKAAGDAIHRIDPPGGGQKQPAVGRQN
jgi:HEAT repeat protein